MSDDGYSPLRVLVVDDCPDMTASMALLLRCWGHEAREAHDGPEALCVAASFHPDVILLDIGLPGPDGYEVARQLRQTEGLGRAFLATLSGYGRPEDKRRSWEAGCDQHWLKPLDPDVLERLLAAEKMARCKTATSVPETVAIPAENRVHPEATAPTKIAEQAEARLRGNAYLALKYVSCECRDGVLTLRGCVPSYYLKQVAQAAVAAIDGVSRIKNEIEVAVPPRRGS